MRMKPLGRTGLLVSELCLGTMTFGQQNTEAEGHAQLDHALASGINFIDTAELYSIPPKRETQGSTERIIGTWLKARGRRDDVIIATKAVGRTAFDWFRDPPEPGRITRAQLTQALDQSLKRLQTDYIDLYQFHYPDRPVPFGANPTRYDPAVFAAAADETPIEESVAVIEDFVKAGKIRHFGLSNESAWGTMTFLAAARLRPAARVQSIQNAYNLLNRTYETALAEVSIREGVSLLGYSPLAQGFLTGKYLDGARPPGARTTLFDRGQRYETPGANDAVRDYLALARTHGLDPSQMAIAFVLTRPFLTSSIIGATTMVQLQTAIDAAGLTLSPDVLKGIDAIHQRYGNPCP